VTIAAANKKLQRALRRLERAGGPVALRNARRDVLVALRALRNAVDEERPAPRRKGKRPRKRRTPNQIEQALLAEGWENVSYAVHIMRSLSAAGVRMRVVRTLGRIRASSTYAPGWAVSIAEHQPAALYKARRSIIERKAILAEIELAR
jgi:hypothetical protein